MQDADLLSMTDATGALLWHPHGLEDIERLSARTLRLWRDMRDGAAARDQPFTWLRVRGIPTSHLYEASPLGPTQARCGHQPDGPLVAGDDTRCRACSAITTRDAAPRVGWGTVGDTLLGPDGHPLGGET